MRTGIYLDLRNPPGWRRPWADLYRSTLRTVSLAEDRGIDSVWLSEHHLFEDGYLPQPLTMAAAIAAATKRIRIGTAVLIPGLRSAIDVAEQAALVDILSDGRLELGLGAGYRVPEFRAFGADPSRRFELLEERIVEIQRLFKEGVVTPPPVSGTVPMWVGAMGPRGARIAGRNGTGLLWLGRKLIAPYREGLIQGGHDPSSGRTGGVANMLVTEDPEASWPILKPFLAYQRDTYNRYGGEGRGDDGRPVAGTINASADPVDPETLRRPGPNGRPASFEILTPEDAIARLRERLEGTPATDVFFWASFAGMPDELADRHIELIAERVAPALSTMRPTV